MAKPVELTVKFRDDSVHTWKCHLLDDIPIVMLNGKPIHGWLKRRADEGHYIFEDQDGVFGIEPERVISIKEL